MLSHVILTLISTVAVLHPLNNEHVTIYTFAMMTTINKLLKKGDGDDIGPFPLSIRFGGLKCPVLPHLDVFT